MFCQRQTFLLRQILNSLISYQPVKEREPIKYCSQFDNQTCSKTPGCAFFIDRCLEFTACSSYLQDPKELCQKISNFCITNGERCMDIGECSSYKSSTSCVKVAVGSYCYWEENKCSKATSCDKLLKFLKTDADCRSINSECTASTFGGCQISGWSCQNQGGELQCVWDRFMKTKCNLDVVACFDRSCSSAPISIVFIC